MTTDLDLRNLHAELIKLKSFHDLALEDLKKLPERGLAHDHVLLGERLWKGHRLLARVPRQAHRDLSPEEGLNLQGECFRRAAPSRHTPTLHETVPPTPRLPNGALIVDAVEGRAPTLPGDLTEIAECLASVHRLPLPDVLVPLAVVENPLKALFELIETQAKFVPALVSDRDVLAILEEEYAWARGYVRENSAAEQLKTLVLTDTHPGNFLIRRDGRATFVDMEKAQYGAPAIDLAHATLHTSVKWDPAVSGELSNEDVAEFYESYMMAVPPSLARAMEPTLLPFRRLTWLRTTTWGCRWYAENGIAVERSRGEGDRVRMLRGVIERLRFMTRRETIERVRGEWRGPNRLELD